MKEININIEGYNVNGICVGCLNYNRKMFYHRDVVEFYRIFGDIDVPDGLVIQVCWQCLASVRAAKKFQELILRSYDVLSKYSRKHTFLDSPEDLTKHSYNNLSAVVQDCFSTDVGEDTKVVTVSVKEEEDFLNYEIEPKEEIEVKDSLEDFGDDYHDAPDLPPEPVTSDDDVQLSKLKRKKEKKEKRKKEKKRKEKPKQQKDIQKHSKKLKNLPEGLVDLYTMSEEEMWRIRAADAVNENFTKLPNRCDDCVIAFNAPRLMQDHMNGKHRKKSRDCHQCDVCKAYFLNRDNLSSHRALHLIAFKCTECGVMSSNKRLIAAHVSQHVAKDLVCKQCGSTFSTKSKLTYHRSTCDQERPQCDCCGKVFANKMTLKHHLKSPQKREEPKEKLYIPCKGCNKVFHSKKSFRSHVVIHEGLTYPCPICGKLFQWKRNLARHTRNHRERDAGALHECRDCGKTFSSRDCYNNHMRLSKRHVPEEGYNHECSHCGKKFPTKWCMVDHIDWDHLKRIKYQCSVCFKAFKTAKIMVAHMNNIHEGKKKEPEGEHLCDICGKSYKTVKRLKGHVWAMHTRRSSHKSFKCQLCPATFTWQTSIYKHMKMMHDAKKNKQPRPQPQVKKQEPYPGIELANRMQYFQQNIANNLVSNMVHHTPIQPTIGVSNI